MHHLPRISILALTRILTPDGGFPCICRGISPTSVFWRIDATVCANRHPWYLLPTKNKLGSLRVLWRRYASEIDCIHLIIDSKSLSGTESQLECVPGITIY
jgi:hypothetical protein